MAPHPPLRPLVAALLRGELERVPPLLEKGIDPNDAWLDGDQETPLMVAAGSGYEDMVDLLLAAGADASARDVHGRTACIWAAGVHRMALADKLWQAQTGKSPSELTASDLSPTKLDDIVTPLTSPGTYLAFDNWGASGQFFAMGAEENPEAALRLISDDNNKMVMRGPYLLCRRISLPQDAHRRPTNPLARSLLAYRATPGELLVLAHLPTTSSSDPGRSLSRHRDHDCRGWAAITALFAEEAEAEARDAALAEPGRVDLVQLLEVCTCYEGRVEKYEGLVKTTDTLDTIGDSQTHKFKNESKSVEESPTISPQRQPVQQTAAPRRPLRPISIGESFCIEQGYQIFRQYPGGFMGFTLVVTLLAIVLAVLAYDLPPLLVTAGVSALLGFLAAGFFRVSLALAQRNTVRFSDFFASLAQGIALSTFALLVWGLALLTTHVPAMGLLLAYGAVGSMYAAPLIVDRSLGLGVAIAESWRITHTRFFDHLFQASVIALTAISGLALFGVGAFVSLPLAGCILTTAYKKTQL